MENPYGECALARPGQLRSAIRDPRSAIRVSSGRGFLGRAAPGDDIGSHSSGCGRGLLHKRFDLFWLSGCPARGPLDSSIVEYIYVFYPHADVGVASESGTQALNHRTIVGGVGQVVEGVSAHVESGFD